MEIKKEIIKPSCLCWQQVNRIGKGKEISLRWQPSKTTKRIASLEGQWYGVNKSHKGPGKRRRQNLQRNTLHIYSIQPEESYNSGVFPLCQKNSDGTSQRFQCSHKCSDAQAYIIGIDLQAKHDT